MVGSAGNLRLLGQVQFESGTGSQAGTANVWKARAPGFVEGTLPGSHYGDASMGGAIIDNRTGAYLTKKISILGVTLPLWAWVLAGVIVYKVIK